MWNPLAQSTPCVPLKDRYFQGVSRFPASDEAMCIWKVSCDPKQVWRNVQQDILNPSLDWRSDVLEMVLKIQVYIGSMMKELTCLVDTGARLPLTFKSGTFAKQKLRRAKLPVKFTTVTGDTMTGGSEGVFMSLRIPVCTEKDQFVFVKTRPLFAYEANVCGVDLIIGYPFLKAFNLVIDCGRDRLSFGRPIAAAAVFVKSPGIVLEEANMGKKRMRQTSSMQNQPTVVARPLGNPSLEGNDSALCTRHNESDEFADELLQTDAELYRQPVHNSFCGRRDR